MHELVESVYYKDNVKTSDGEVNKASKEATIKTRIGKKCAILIGEFQVLFHGKRGNPRAKLTTII